MADSNSGYWKRKKHAISKTADEIMKKKKRSLMVWRKCILQFKIILEMDAQTLEVFKGRNDTVYTNSKEKYICKFASRFHMPS